MITHVLLWDSFLSVIDAKTWARFDIWKKKNLSKIPIIYFSKCNNLPGKIPLISLPLACDGINMTSSWFLRARFRCAMERKHLFEGSLNNWRHAVIPLTFSSIRGGMIWGLSFSSSCQHLSRWVNGEKDQVSPRLTVTFLAITERWRVVLNSHSPNHCSTCQIITWIILIASCVPGHRQRQKKTCFVFSSEDTLEIH